MKRPQLTANLTGKLARNTVFNIIGQAVPLVAAYFTIPILIRGLGEDRNGALMLTWMLAGYASIFDLGLSRALTQMVAQRLKPTDIKNTKNIKTNNSENTNLENPSSKKTSDLSNNMSIASLVATALTTIVGFSVLAAILLYLLSPWLAVNIFKVNGELYTETLQALQYIAIFFPIIILTTGLLGILEAYQRFLTINIISIPFGLLHYIVPVMILPFSNKLQIIVLAMLGLRTANTIAYLVFCLREVSWREWHINPRAIPRLFSLSSWMSISNIVGPLLMSIDRFFVSRFMNLQAVTYYTTPQNMIIKMRIIPIALIRALFPALTSEFEHSSQRAARVYRNSILALAVTMLPLTGFIIIFAKLGLTLWLDADFAAASYRVVQILAASIFIYSLGQPAATVIQALGRPDITAKLHLAEVPFYVAALVILINQYGIVGAAIAWFLRATFSTAVLMYLVPRLIRNHSASKSSRQELT